MKITYCMMTWNRLYDTMRAIERVKPYVDRVVVVDGGSTDDTILTLRNYEGVELYLHPWEDVFSKQRTNYLNRAGENGGTDWVLVSDPDELFSVEALENMRKEIDNCGPYNMLAFESNSVSMKGPIVVNHTHDKYWKPLLFKWNPGIHYTGNPHETLIIDGGNRVKNLPYHYYHIKQDNMCWHRGYRNFHIGGGGPNMGDSNEHWVSYKKVLKHIYGEAPSWHKMEPLLLAGNIDDRLKEWMYQAKDVTGFDGASEVREAYKTYFRIFHPEEEPEQFKGTHIE
jgi:glycosyltransferase involved in cell wall biosynthesis